MLITNDLLKGEFSLNILHLIFSFERGGAETYLLNLVKKMNNEDLDFFIVCDHEGYNHKAIKESCDNIEIIKMKSIFDIKGAFQIAKYCKKNNIDIIHTHFLRESYLAVLSKIFNPRIKVVWTMHFIYEKSSLLRFLNRLFSIFTDKIICVSNAVKNALVLEKISEKKTITIYNGVDTEYFKPGIGHGVRNELGIKEDELMLITAARFQEAKGHDFLIESLIEFKKHKVKFKSVLVGDGEEKEKIENKVDRLGLKEEVIILGYREDIPRLLSASDIYLSPSVSEAISFSILEALSSEVPVVATEVGGVPEILKDTNCGILVPYGDKEAFSNGIYDLYKSHNYMNMKKIGRKLVIEKFSMDSMIDKTYNLYEVLLNGR